MSEILDVLDVNIILKYTIALAIILSIKLVSPIISRIIIFTFHKIFKIKTKTKDSGFYSPLKFLLTLIGIGIAIYFIAPPRNVINLYNKIFKILLILIVAKALANCLTPKSTFFTKLEKSEKFNNNEALNTFIIKFLKVIIYIVAGFMILSDLDYDLGGLVAGLGIGSAALALAAQDFVKSIIGGFAIISDKTFEIGDYIQVRDIEGTVIDMTFRSTKIKALNNSIISIPNSVIVTENVQNCSKIENRRIDIRLRISLESTTNTINNCISKLKTMLKANDNIVSQSVSITLEDIKNDANVIWIIAYLNTSEYEECLKIKGEINCSILEILERENIDLVYPTQKVYMKTV